MNPIMLLIVILIAVAIWFLLAFMYKPLGKIVYRIWNDVVNEIKNNEEKESK